MKKSNKFTGGYNTLKNVYYSLTNIISLRTILMMSLILFVSILPTFADNYDDYHKVTTFTAIRDAILEEAGNSIVKIKLESDIGADQVSESVTLHEKSIIIDGYKAEKSVYNLVADSSNHRAAIVEKTSSLTLKNTTLSLFTIQQGNTVKNELSGGVIYSEGDLIIDNVSFFDNKALNKDEKGKLIDITKIITGGAIYAGDGSVQITDSTFSRNFARRGGAVASKDFSDTSVRIVNSEFVTNSAVVGGGAISNGGDMTIIDSSFRDNYLTAERKTSVNGGGAVRNIATMIFNSTAEGRNELIGNTAYYNGGALFSRSSSGAADVLFLGNVSFIGNKTIPSETHTVDSDFANSLETLTKLGNDKILTTGGGAIFNDNKMDFGTYNERTGLVEFLSNETKGSGGAIFNDENGIIHIYGPAQFGYDEDDKENKTLGNKAVGSGGAVFNKGIFNINSMRGTSYFNYNTADMYGGAIRNSEDGLLRILGSTAYIGNYAKLGGGAISNVGDFSLSGNAVFKNNGSAQGGAIFNKGDLYITGNMLFEGNTVKYKEHQGRDYYTNGGAIYNLGGNLKVIGTRSETSNIANGICEAFVTSKIVPDTFSLGESSILFKNNSAIDNANYGEGGAIWVGGDKTTGAIANLFISSTDFLGNKSRRSGAIRTEANAEGQSSFSNIYDCYFQGNYALTYGGAVGSGGENADVIIINSTFVGNYQTDGTTYGGAVTNGHDLTIINSEFYGNYGTYRGGAVGYNGRNLRIIADGRDTIFSGNGATDKDDRSTNCLTISSEESFNLAKEDPNNDRILAKVYINAGNGGRVIFNDTVTSDGSTPTIKDEYAVTDEANRKGKLFYADIYINAVEDLRTESYDGNGNTTKYFVDLSKYSYYRPNATGTDFDYIELETPNHGDIYFNDTVLRSNIHLYNGTLHIGYDPTQLTSGNKYLTNSNLFLHGGTLDLTNNYIHGKDYEYLKPASFIVDGDVNLRLDIDIKNKVSDYIHTAINIKDGATLTIDKLLFLTELEGSTLDTDGVIKRVDIPFALKVVADGTEKTGKIELLDTLKTVITSKAGYGLELTATDKNSGLNRLTIYEKVNAGGLPVAVSVGDIFDVTTYIYSATEDEIVNNWYLPYTYVDDNDSENPIKSATTSYVLKGDKLVINGNGKNVQGIPNGEDGKVPDANVIGTTDNVVGILIAKENQTDDKKQILVINDVGTSHKENSDVVYKGWFGFNSAIINQGGILQVNDSIFTNNNAYTDITNALCNGNGGAIRNTDGGVVTIENTSFIGNTATGRGGAIYNEGGIVNIFAENTAEAHYYFNNNNLVTRTKDAEGNIEFTKIKSEDIFNKNGTINLSTDSTSVLTFNGGIAGASDNNIDNNIINIGNINLRDEAGNETGVIRTHRGLIEFNDTISNSHLILNQGTVAFGQNIDQLKADAVANSTTYTPINYLENVDLTLKGGTLNFQNSQIDTLNVNTLSLQGTINLMLDVNLSSDYLADQFVVDALIGDGAFNISKLNLTGDMPEGVYTITAKFINDNSVASYIEAENRSINYNNTVYSVTVENNVLTILKEGGLGDFPYAVAIDDTAERVYKVGLRAEETVVNRWISGNNKMAGVSFYIDGKAINEHDEQLAINGLDHRGIYVGRTNTGSLQYLDVANVVSYKNFNTAFMNNGGNILVHNTTFENNIATFVDVDGVTLDGNGGVVANNKGIFAVRDGSIFQNNSAEGFGGAIYNNDEFMIFTKMVEGVDEVTGKSIMVPERVIFTENYAKNGGEDFVANDLYQTIIGTTTISTGAGGEVVFDGGIAGSGLFEKLGAGTLYLNGDNSKYDGYFILEGAIISGQNEIFAGNTIVAPDAKFVTGAVRIGKTTFCWFTENDFEYDDAYRPYVDSVTGKTMYPVLQDKSTITYSTDESNRVYQLTFAGTDVVIGNGVDPAKFTYDVGATARVKNANGTYDPDTVSKLTINKNATFITKQAMVFTSNVYGEGTFVNDHTNIEFDSAIDGFNGIYEQYGGTTTVSGDIYVNRLTVNDGDISFKSGAVYYSPEDSYINLKNANLTGDIYLSTGSTSYDMTITGNTTVNGNVAKLKEVGSTAKAYVTLMATEEAPNPTLIFSADAFSNANLDVQAGTLKTQNLKAETITIDTLSSVAEANYQVDFVYNKATNTVSSDLFKVGMDSLGTITLSDIRFSGGTETGRYIIKVIDDSQGVPNVTLALTQELKDKIASTEAGTRQESFIIKNGADKTVKGNHKQVVDNKVLSTDEYVRWTRDGSVSGSIDISSEDPHSVELLVNETIWHSYIDNGVVDTLVALNQKVIDEQKIFEFVEKGGTYKLTQDLGTTYGKLNIIGNETTIDLDGNGGFALTKDSVLSLDNVTLLTGNRTLMTAIQGSTIKLKDSTLDGNISNTTRYRLELQGDTKLQGLAGGADAYLYGAKSVLRVSAGTLSNAILTVDAGALDLSKDDLINTTTVGKFITENDAKLNLRIDVDLAQTGNKSDILSLGLGSTGNIEIDSINFVQGDPTQTFSTKVIASSDEDYNVNLTLSDNLKNKEYLISENESKTYLLRNELAEELDDVYNTITTEDKYNRYTKTGDRYGSLKIAEDNKTLELVDFMKWGTPTGGEEISSLAYLNQKNTEEIKTFKLITGSQYYEVKADLGGTIGHLIIDGTETNNAVIDLVGKSGFESSEGALLELKKVTLTDSTIANIEDRNLVNLSSATEVIVLNNSTLDGNITNSAINKYTLRIVGESEIKGTVDNSTTVLYENSSVLRVADDSLADAKLRVYGGTLDLTGNGKGVTTIGELATTAKDDKTPTVLNLNIDVVKIAEGNVVADSLFVKLAPPKTTVVLNDINFINEDLTTWLIDETFKVQVLDVVEAYAENVKLELGASIANRIFRAPGSVSEDFYILTTATQTEPTDYTDVNNEKQNVEADVKYSDDYAIWRKVGNKFGRIVISEDDPTGHSIELKVLGTDYGEGTEQYSRIGTLDKLVALNQLETAEKTFTFDVVNATYTTTSALGNTYGKLLIIGDNSSLNVAKGGFELGENAVELNLSNLNLAGNSTYLINVANSDVVINLMNTTINGKIIASSEVSGYDLNLEGDIVLNNTVDRANATLSGETSVLKVASKSLATSVLNVKAGTLDMRGDYTATVTEIAKLLVDDDSSLNAKVNFVKKYTGSDFEVVSDVLKVGADSKGLVTITDIYFEGIGDASTATVEHTFGPVKVIDTESANVVLALDSALKNKKYVLSNVTEQSYVIKNWVAGKEKEEGFQYARASIVTEENFSLTSKDTFTTWKKSGHDYGYIDISEADAHSVELTVSGTDWETYTRTGTLDTLALLNQMDSGDVEKTFTIVEGATTYSAIDDMGITVGALNIVTDVANGVDHGEIDFRGFDGFYLKNNSNLSLTNITLIATRLTKSLEPINNVTVNKVIDVLEDGVVINVTNSNIDGNIISAPEVTSYELNLNGGTIMLNGKVDKANAVLESDTTLKIVYSTLAKASLNAKNNSTLDLSCTGQIDTEIGNFTTATTDVMNLKIDVVNEEGEILADIVKMGAGSKGNIHIKDIVFDGDVTSAPFEVQVIDADEKVVVTLDDSIKNVVYTNIDTSRENFITKNDADKTVIENQIKTVENAVLSSDKYTTWTKVGQDYGSIKLSGENNHNLALTVDGTDWTTYTETGMLDTLSVLNQKDVGEVEKTYTFVEGYLTHSATANMGETVGTLTINGIEGAKVDLLSTDTKGFELKTATSQLNLKDVTLNGGATVTNADAKVNLNNTTLKGSIASDVAYSLGLNGNTTITGTVNNANASLKADAVVKVANNTFANATLISNGGRIDTSKDNVFNNVQIGTLSGTEPLKIDIDVKSATSQSDSLTISNGSGKVVINSINFIAGNPVAFFETTIINSGDVVLELASTIETRYAISVINSASTRYYILNGESDTHLDTINDTVYSSDGYELFTQKGTDYGTLQIKDNKILTLIADETPTWDASTEESLGIIGTLATLNKKESTDKNFIFKDEAKTYTTKFTMGETYGTLKITGLLDADNNIDATIMMFENDLKGFILGETSTSINVKNVLITPKNASAADVFATVTATGKTINLENVILDNKIDANINYALGLKGKIALNNTVGKAQATLSGENAQLTVSKTALKEASLTVDTSSAKLDLGNNTIETTEIAELQTGSNTLKTTLDMDASTTTPKSDVLQLGADSVGKVEISKVNFIDTTKLDESFKVQVIDTTSDDINLTITDTTTYSAIGNRSVDYIVLNNNGDEELSKVKQTVYSNDVYENWNKKGTVDGQLKVSTTDKYIIEMVADEASVVWNQRASKGTKLDALATLNREISYATKDFTFVELAKTYTAKEDMGETIGTLNINGNGIEGAKLNLKSTDTKGFKLITSTAQLNLNDVTLVGGATVTGVNSKINLNNATLNGNITADVSYNLGLSGNTTITGTVGTVKATLNNGVLKVATNTLEKAILNGVAGSLSLQNNKTETTSIGTLTGVLGVIFDIDAKSGAIKSDVLSLGASSNATITADINFLNQTALKEGFRVKVLNTDSENITLQLADTIADTVFENIGTRTRNYILLTHSNGDKEEVEGVYNSVFSSDIYENKTQNGTVNGKLAVDGDSIVMTVDGETKWINTTARTTDIIDSFVTLNQKDTTEDKEFIFDSANETLRLTSELGKTQGKSLIVLGDKSTIILASTDKAGFILDDNKALYIDNVTLNGSSAVITANSNTSSVALANSTLNGTISSTAGYSLKLYGNTTLNGSVGTTNAVLNSGVLKVARTALSNATFSAIGGVLDLQNSIAETTTIGKLTTDLNINIDVNATGTGASDKLKLTDSTSTGKVTITDIKFVNTARPTDKFNVQVLDTTSSATLAIGEGVNTNYTNVCDANDSYVTLDRVKTEIADKVYSNDNYELWTGVGYKNGILEVGADNRSLKITITDTVWTNETYSNIDVLARLNQKASASKSYNFVSETETYTAIANMGETAGSLTINGIEGTNINLLSTDVKGFELKTSTAELKLNDVTLNGGATVTNADAKVYLKNVTLNGAIASSVAYSLALDGDITLNGSVGTANASLNTGADVKVANDTFANAKLIANGGLLDLSGVHYKSNAYIGVLESTVENPLYVELQVRPATAESDTLTIGSLANDTGKIIISDIDFIGGEPTSAFETIIINSDNSNLKLELGSSIKTLYNLSAIDSESETYYILNEGTASEERVEAIKDVVLSTDKFGLYARKGTIQGILQILDDNKTLALVENGTPTWNSDTQELVNVVGTLATLNKKNSALKEFNFVADEEGNSTYTTSFTMGNTYGTLKINGLLDGDNIVSELNMFENDIDGFIITDDTTAINVKNVVITHIDSSSADIFATVQTSGKTISLENVVLDSKIVTSAVADSLAYNLNISGKTTLKDTIGKANATLSGATSVLTVGKTTLKEAKLNVEAGGLNLQNDATETTEIGTLETGANTLNLTLDMDASTQTAKSDVLKVGSASKGKVSISDVNFLDTTNLKEGFKVKVIDTTSNDIELAIADTTTYSAIGTRTADYIALNGNGVVELSGVNATVKSNDVYENWTKQGTVDGQLKVSETERYTLELVADENSVVWYARASKGTTLDALAELNKAEYLTKEFNFVEEAKVYNAKDEMGVAYRTLSINGIEGAVLNLATTDTKGFELMTSSAVLNLKDLTLNGGATVGATNANISLNNVKLNAGITSDVAYYLRLAGNNEITGTVGKATATLTSGSNLKVATSTLANATLNAVGGTLILQNSSTQTTSIATLTGSLNIALDINAETGNITSDVLKIGSASTGTVVTITNIDFLKDSALKEAFSVKVIDSTTENITLKLDSSVNTKYSKIGTRSEDYVALSTDKTNRLTSIPDSITSNQVYKNYTIYGTVDGELTVGSENKSLVINAVGDTTWDNDTIVEGSKIDSLIALNQKETTNDKTFTFASADEIYNLSGALGTMKGNKLSIVGNNSTINLEGLDLAGFVLGSDKELNLSKVTVKGNSAVITVNNSSSKVNLTDVTLNGAISSTVGYTLNLSGNTTLSSSVGTANAILKDGNLKVSQTALANASLKAVSGTLDLQNSSTQTTSIATLTGSLNVALDINAKENNISSDVLSIGSATTGTKITITDINFLDRSALKENFKVQVVSSDSNNITLELGSSIDKGCTNIATTTDNYIALDTDEARLTRLYAIPDSVTSDEVYKNYSIVGYIDGELAIADNKYLIINAVEPTRWDNDTIVEGSTIDTFVALYNKASANKTFTFANEGETRKITGTLGEMSGAKLTIVGKNTTINLDGSDNSGFTLGAGQELSLSGATLNGKSAVITANNSTVNLKDVTLNGKISTDDGYTLNLSGNTTLTGAIGTADVTLKDGNLIVGKTALENATLTAVGGMLDLQNNVTETTTIGKLASNMTVSIDIDATGTGASDKLALGSESTGTVTISDIKFINASSIKTTDFRVQVLDTESTAKIVLGEGVSTSYTNIGEASDSYIIKDRTTIGLADVVSSNDVYELCVKQGYLNGNLTVGEDNQSLVISLGETTWTSTEYQAIDVLARLNQKETTNDKTFTIVADDEGNAKYEATENMGATKGTLTIVSEVDGAILNLKDKEGFNLDSENSKLNLKGVIVCNANDSNLATVSNALAEITLTDVYLIDNIKATEKYNLNIAGKTTLLGTTQNAKVDVKEGAYLTLLKDNHFTNSNVTFNNGSTLDLTNGYAQTQAGSFHINGTLKMVVEADLKAGLMDRLSENTTFENDSSKIDVSKVNVLSDSSKKFVAIAFAHDSYKDKVEYSGETEVGATTATLTRDAMGPIYKYKVAYDETNGNFTFSRGGGAGKNGGKFNPAIMSSGIASQVGAYTDMLNTYDMAFGTMEMRMLMPSRLRKAEADANKYAICDTDGTQTTPLCASIECNSSSIWFKPYTSYDRVNLHGGPKVQCTSYGTFAGGDLNLRKLRNGFEGNLSPYLSYMGSYQVYSGNHIDQNGGAIGLVGTLYKGNFFTGLTISVGANVTEESTMFGRADFPMLMAGVASKTGYNFEFKNGSFIIQPSMMMSYTFINAFDYKNAVGVNLQHDALNTIHFAPSIKFIKNTKNNWQPYFLVGMRWNVMGTTGIKANDISLPELSINPYVEYGIGIHKRVNDTFSGYSQVTIRNGGRNGIAAMFGFKFMLGKKFIHSL